MWTTSPQLGPILLARSKPLVQPSLRGRRLHKNVDIQHEITGGHLYVHTGVFETWWWFKIQISESEPQESLNHKFRGPRTSISHKFPWLIVALVGRSPHLEKQGCNKLASNHTRSSLSISLAFSLGMFQISWLPFIKNHPIKSFSCVFLGK